MCLPRHTDSVSPPPHPLPAERCKGQPRKGVGEDRIWQPYCHTVSALECLFPQGGNAVRFFLFVFSVSGPVSFAVFCRSFFLRVVFLKNFRERTFVFGWLCLSCVFWWFFAYVFAYIFRGSLPKLFEKILLMSGLVLSGVVLSSLGFSPTSFLFLFVFSVERQRSGSNRTPPHTHLFFWFFFFFVSRRVCLFCPFWPCVPLLGVFPGCHSGPRAFWDSPGTCSEAPFSWDARRQGCSVLLVLGFFFSPSVLFCGHAFSRCPSR